MFSSLGVRARFTLLYGISMIITVVLFSGGIYYFVQWALLGQVENHLRKDFATINEYLQHDFSSLAKVADHGPILLFTVWEGNKPLISSDDWNSEKLGQVGTAQGSTNSLFSVRNPNSRQFRVLIGKTEHNGRLYRITIAHAEDSVRETRKTLALIILLALPIVVTISLVSGYVIAGRVLAPIGAITRKAEEIGAENLSERLPVGTTDDEFNRLATVFNQAFTRIEDSFARLRRFTADASHELRTPLAAIRSIGETALHASGEYGNCREAVGSILEESDRLRQLTDALLQLSRADAGEVEQQLESVELAELVQETVEFMGVLAEEKHQTINIIATGNTVVQLDRASIRQAMTNLLDNAIKYAPQESEIIITIGINAHDEAFVEIADGGAGIPESDLPHIFDRFYRVDKGRSREKGGAGLGLAITRWAVEINGGRIEVESKIKQGCVFRILFPVLI